MKKNQKKKNDKYRIEGRLYPWIDKSSDSRDKELDKTFSAPDDETAMKMGVEIAKEFLDKNKEYIKHNFVGGRSSFDFSLSKVVWEKIYDEKSVR